MSKKQRIAINIQGDRNWIGGSIYTQNLIFALAQLPKEVRNQYELVLIGNQSGFEFIKNLRLYVDEVFFREIDFKPVTFANRVQWKVLRMLTGHSNHRTDEFIRRNKINFIYPYFSPDIHFKEYRSAALIYDFQHKYLPEFFSKEDIQKRDHSFAKIAQFSPTVVVSSQTAAKDFCKFFPKSRAEIKILSFKTFSPPDWYAPEPKDIQEKYNLPERFFLISNQFWQHKNHLMVLEALKFLKAQSLEPNIVCTGCLYDYRKPEYTDQVLEAIHCSGLAHQVYLLGVIKRLDQIQLMRRSLAVIQPSLFEGWSTVIEDARCLGKPVIMSDLEVNIEQNPPNNRVYERHSVEDLALILADWWERLQPGPDKDREKQARENNIAEVQKFGYSFLNIALNTE